MIKNIIFDFDGVICESVNIKTDAFYELYLPYGIDIANKVKQHHLDNGGMSRFDKFKYYHDIFLDKNISPKELNKLSKVFSDLVMQKIIDAPFVTGLLDFLENQSPKYKCFIVSATPMQEMKEICDSKSISKYFEEIFGSPTSKDVWVEKILKDHNLNKNETLFIGDAMSDYNASQYNEILFLLRNTPENIHLFKNKNVKSINDFINFDYVLKEII